MEDDKKCPEIQIKNLLGPALYRSCTSYWNVYIFLYIFTTFSSRCFTRLLRWTCLISIQARPQISPGGVHNAN
jgi:hypothetical protein